MKKITLFVFIIIPFFLSAKEYKIQGNIKNYNSAQVFLSSVYGDKLDILDSTLTDRDGNFQFLFSQDQPNGMYRLFFANNKKLDLLFNYENIIFESNVSDPINSIVVKESVENKTYYKYLLRKNYDQYRLELLQPVLMYYPKTDVFFKTISSEFNSIQKGLSEFTRDLLYLNKDTYAAALIAMEQKPLLLPDLNPEQQQMYLREHYFESVKFDNESLLRSNVITSTILSYLSLYQNQNLSKDQLEDEFIKAVNIILSHSKSNIEIHNFVIDYLINGFENYGFNKVINHMADWLSNPENCDMPEDSNSLKERLNTIKKLAPGNQAPNIIETDLAGNTINLNEIKSKFTLVVFWASWCPHCKNLLTELDRFYHSQKDKLAMVSISIDTSKTDMNTYLKTLKPEWKTIADFKGWDGKTAIDYGIHSTPSMFLLDEKKKILGKAESIFELQQLMK
ncbi:MAG: AhpC/TSA family protein [Bacteroidetes bacterium]|nr:AhpC/TSA family protein [Bacteroidota bacterium]